MTKLTVGKLKELLEEHDDNLVVWSEGCDCVEEAGDIVHYEGGVMIKRYRAPRSYNEPAKPRPTLEQLERELGI